MGKLFTALLARRLERYLRSNHYWDSTQKGFASATQGCVEHAFCMQEVLHEARSRQVNISVAWLDLKNAFGSIHHRHIQLALRRFSVPPVWSTIIHSLYCSLSARVVSPTWATDYFPYHRGVFQGDPLSPVIFNMVFAPVIALIKATNTSPYVSRFGVKFGVAAYADDLAVVTKSHQKLQGTIDALGPLFLWLGLAFNPKKCVSLSLVHGKLPDPPLQLFINLVPIPNLKLEESFKFLGTQIPASGNLQAVFASITSVAEKWWDIISRATITIPAKLFCFRYSLSRLRWHLTAYDWPLSSVDALQAAALRRIRLWVGLPPTANAHVLFSLRGLALPHLPTIFKSSQISKHAHLASTLDATVSGLHSHRHVDGRSSFDVAAVLSTIRGFCSAEDFTQEILGPANRQRRGLGFLPPHSARRLSPPRRVTRYLREEQDHLSLEATLALPSLTPLWSAIEQDMTNDRHWKAALLGLPDKLLTFALKAAANVLPTNRTLKLWRKLASDACPLCSTMQTLGHVLNGCPVSLTQGRYTFRHDLVLGTVVSALASAVPSLAFHYFFDYLEDTSSYAFSLHFQSNLRPDLIISAPDSNRLWIVELTVPLPHRTGTSHALKAAKYASLVQPASLVGWAVEVLAVEVSSFGNVARSVPVALRSIGVPPPKSRAILSLLSRAAIGGSHTVFAHRNLPSMARQDLLGFLGPLPLPRVCLPSATSPLPPLSFVRGPLLPVGSAPSEGDVASDSSHSTLDPLMPLPAEPPPSKRTRGRSSKDRIPSCLGVCASSAAPPLEGFRDSDSGLSSAALAPSLVAAQPKRPRGRPKGKKTSP